MYVFPDWGINPGPSALKSSAHPIEPMEAMYVDNVVQI